MNARVFTPERTAAKTLAAMTSEEETLHLAERIAYLEGRVGIPWRAVPAFDAPVDWREGGRIWSAWTRGRFDARQESSNRTFKILMGVMMALYVVVIVAILTVLG